MLKQKRERHLNSLALLTLEKRQLGQQEGEESGIL